MEESQDPYRRAALLLRYLRKVASFDEQQQVDAWLKEDARNREFLDQLQSEQGMSHEKDFFDHSDKAAAWAGIEQAIRVKTRKLWPRIAAAASILIFLSIGGYFLLSKQSDQQLVKIKTSDIAPGSNKAILTLANGKQVILNNAKNGELVKQGNATITKTQNGQILYQASDKGVVTDVAYNTITTPRGGEYYITLADGTNVWLNAASSVTYPTTFNGNDRTVEITGEAYFEVAHNAAKPFRVKSHGQTVQVLGTHFDVNAYDDESTIRTTLLEGSVKITTGNHTDVLQPGQQSQVSIAENANGVFKGIQNVDTDEAVAWKNGSFRFDRADIKAIMRQFARWYNVDVAYQGNIDERVFSGSIYRNLSASKALELLSLANVHFIIDGKKIIVSE